MKAVTIKDVAKKAGVSIATVSYVLNGSRKVSAATAQKVLEAAADLGYTPNTLAQALAGKQTRYLAVAVTNNFSQLSSDSGLSEILYGIGEATYAADYSFSLLFADQITPELIAELAGKVVEALLAIGFPPAHLPKAPFPIICGGLSYSTNPDPAGNGVWFSYQDVLNLATKHLIELGRRHLLLLAPAGVCSAAPTDLPLAHVLAEPTSAGGYWAIDKIARTRTFDGIIAFNDGMAIGALRALGRHHIKVPEEVAIVGCTDAPVASYSEPPLTTVRLPWRALGQAMVARFLGDKIPNLIPPKLVIRESCGSALWI